MRITVRINKILRDSFFSVITVSLIAKCRTSESVLHQIDGGKIEIYYKPFSRMLQRKGYTTGLTYRWRVFPTIWGNIIYTVQALFTLVAHSTKIKSLLCAFESVPEIFIQPSGVKSFHSFLSLIILLIQPLKTT